MGKIIFSDNENQIKYEDVPANVFTAVKQLMDAYSDIYSEINKLDCVSRKAVTLNNPCKDCSEKTWCGGFACKEAREYMDNKNKVNRSEQ